LVKFADHSPEGNGPEEAEAKATTAARALAYRNCWKLSGLAGLSRSAAQSRFACGVYRNRYRVCDRRETIRLLKRVRRDEAPSQKRSPPPARRAPLRQSSTLRLRSKATLAGDK
jgi:hypothetical protein